MADEKTKPFREMTPEEKEAYHKGSSNLISWSEFPKDKLREWQSKGGKISRANAVKRKKIRDDMALLLSVQVTDDNMRQWLEDHGLDTSNQMLMCLKTLLKAQTGDIEAAKFVRDTVGEKPVAGVVVGSVSPEDLDGVDMRTLTEEELVSLAQSDEDE